MPSPSSPCLLGKKVATVALSILSGAGIGALIALNYGFNLCLLTSIGGIGGLVIGLVALAVLFKKEKTSVQSIPTKESLEEQVSVELVQKQEAKIANLAQEVENALSAENPLSEQQIDQFLDVVDQTHVVLERQKQFESLLSALETELGTEEAKTVWQVPGLILPEIQDPTYILSNEQITYMVQKAKNYFHNQKLIQEVQTQLAQEGISSSTLNQILSRISSHEYSTGAKALNPEMKAKLIQMARAVHARQAFDQLASEIAELASRDLPLDETLIEKKFNIEAVLKPLSEPDQAARRAQLQHIINRAYLNRELKQKGKMATPLQGEKRLLRYWGYKLQGTAYEDKDQVYEVLNQIIQDQLREDKFKGSISAVRQAIKTCALKARLKMVNITSDPQIAKFQVGLNFLEEQTNKLHTSISNIQIAFPTSFENPELSLAHTLIEESLGYVKEGEIDKGIEKFFNRQVKQNFNNSQIDEQAFKEFLNKNQHRIDRKAIEQACAEGANHPVIKQDLAFYEKWGQFMKKGMMQGYLDSNEVFGDGVCWAICYRLQMLLQKNPALSLEEFVEHVKIMPKDRFRQGIHLVGQRQAKISMRTLPAEFLAKEGFTQDQMLFSLEYNSQEDDLDKKCKFLLSKLSQSEGCMRFHLRMEGGSSHAIDIRLDEKRQLAWVFDPNFGVFAFERAGISFDEIQKRCMEFIKDLTEYSYPTTHEIHAFQVT